MAEKQDDGLDTEWYTVADLARRYKLVREDGSLKTKTVYGLPIRKTHQPGIGVRWHRDDIRKYEADCRRRAFVRGVRAA